MAQPIDQGSILASGRALIPDYAAQLVQEQLLGLRQQEAQTNQARVTAAVTQQSRENAEEDAFNQAVAALGDQPTAQQLAALAIRFPRFSEGVRRGWEMQDEARRTGDFRSVAEIHDAARGGNFDLAARLVRERIAADTAAGGEPDPIDQAILDGLTSTDPAQQRASVDLLERTVAAIAGPDHYASVYGTFSRNTREVDGIIYDADTGEPLFQSPYPRVVSGEGGIYVQPRVSTIPVLGGETAGGAPVGTAPQQAPAGGSGGTESAPGTSTSLGSFDRPAAVNIGGQFGRVTSTVRSPEHNREVGGAANSFHLERNGGRAIDIARRRGVTHAQIVAAYRRAGYTLHPDTRDEGDHSHIVVAAGPSPEAPTGLPRVRSRQEYDRLPRGAQFVDPEGNVRTKS